MHHPPPDVVTQSSMLCDPLLPHNHGPDIPLQANVELRCVHVLKEHAREAVALRGREAENALRVVAIDIQCLTARDGVSNDDWVHCRTRIAEDVLLSGCGPNAVDGLSTVQGIQTF